MRDQLRPADPEKPAGVCLPAAFSTGCTLNLAVKKNFHLLFNALRIKGLKRKFQSLMHNLFFTSGWQLPYVSVRRHVFFWMSSLSFLKD